MSRPPAEDDRLTIVLTLKGRHLMTLRWLWHANRVRLPFRVIVADGEVHPTIARLIEDQAIFPNLHLQYCRYNDLTFSDFYGKFHDAVSRVTTPYVMMSDNDDFLFPSGIRESLAFLERSPDYVCARGGIGHFETRRGIGQHPNLTGRIRALWHQQSRAYQAYDLNDGRASRRVIDAYNGFLTVYYNVYRIEVLRGITAEIMAANFTQLENFELMWMLRAAMAGKLKSDPSYLSYLRQIGTSSNPSKKTDFVATVANEPYIREIQAITNAIAVEAATRGGTDPVEVKRDLDHISAERLRLKLVRLLGWRATFKGWVRAHIPGALMRAFHVAAEQIRSGRSSAAGGRPVSRAEMFRRVSEAGASQTLVDVQQAELAEIETTLQGDDFLAFVQRLASELLTS